MPRIVEVAPGPRAGDLLRDPPAPGLPGYERQLACFHLAFEGELRSLVEGLPLRRGMRVLDLACGDGFYTRCLAERLGAGGLVVGADLNLAYLSGCQESAPRGPDRSGTVFVGARADWLPFPDDTFDQVWCAQSLYSLPDAGAAVAAMVRVLRPGGQLAVLENDVLHHVILPWPVALELSLQAAKLRTIQAECHGAGASELGRRLPALFAAAGLEQLRSTTHAFDRLAPLGHPERELLRTYLEDVLRRATPHLGPELLEELRGLVDPRSAQSLLRRPDLSMTWLCVLATGRKGRPGRPARVGPVRSRPV